MGTRHIQVHDYAKPLYASRPAAGINFFLKMSPSYQAGPRNWKGPADHMMLKPCLPNDPDMCAIELDGNDREVFRPWHLEWIAPGPLSTPEHQARYAQYLNDNDLLGISDQKAYDFPALSNHERLKVSVWRRETHMRIQEYLENPASRPRRIRTA